MAESKQCLAELEQRCGTKGNEWNERCKNGNDLVTAKEEKIDTDGAPESLAVDKQCLAELEQSCATKSDV